MTTSDTRLLAMMQARAAAQRGIGELRAMLELIPQEETRESSREEAFQILANKVSDLSYYIDTDSLLA